MDYKKVKPRFRNIDNPELLEQGKIFEYLEDADEKEAEIIEQHKREKAARRENPPWYIQNRKW